MLLRKKQSKFVNKLLNNLVKKKYEKVYIKMFNDTKSQRTITQHCLPSFVKRKEKKRKRKQRKETSSFLYRNTTKSKYSFIFCFSNILLFSEKFFNFIIKTHSSIIYLLK